MTETQRKVEEASQTAGAAVAKLDAAIAAVRNGDVAAKEEHLAKLQTLRAMAYVISIETSSVRLALCGY